MSLKDKIKKFNDIELGKRFLPDYVFNKSIFRLSMLVVFVMLVLILFNNNFDFSTKILITCPPGGSPCSNPYYQNPGSLLVTDVPDYVDSYIVSLPVFPPGFEYGEKPNFWFKFFPYYVFFVFLNAFVLNHIFFNRRGRKK